MGWIKRNLFFVIGSLIALALMGVAGWFLYSNWTLNNKIFDDLNASYQELKGLKAKSPHPGNEKVNNIEIAKTQQKQLSNFVFSTRVYFQPLPRIPSVEDAPKVTDQAFSASLSRTIDQLTKEATRASVTISSNYSFSFEAEKNWVSFNDPKALLPLSVQLGEVKALCDLLFQAKINSIENIRRERVAPEDSQRGLLTDYLAEKTTTNELATLTPYEIVFKCFSSELGTVLGSFASSPNGVIVKTINVEGAPIPPPQEQPATPPPTIIYQQPIQPVLNQQMQEQDAAARMARRYGLGNRYGGAAQPVAPPPPVYAPQPVAPPPPKSTALTTVLDERQLKVTINLVLVKLLPPGGK